MTGMARWPLGVFRVVGEVKIVWTVQRVVMVGDRFWRLQKTSVCSYFQRLRYVPTVGYVGTPRIVQMVGSPSCQRLAVWNAWNRWWQVRINRLIWIKKSGSHAMYAPAKAETDPAVIPNGTQKDMWTHKSCKLGLDSNVSSRNQKSSVAALQFSQWRNNLERQVATFRDK